MNNFNQNTPTARNIVDALSSIAKIENITRIDTSQYYVKMEVIDFATRDLNNGKVETRTATYTFKSVAEAKKYADNRKAMTERDIEIAIADDQYTLFYVWGSSVVEERELNTPEALNERATAWMNYQFARIEWEQECKQWNTDNGPIFHLKDGQ